MSISKSSWCKKNIYIKTSMVVMSLSGSSVTTSQGLKSGAVVWISDYFCFDLWLNWNLIRAFSARGANVSPQEYSVRKKRSVSLRWTRGRRCKYCTCTELVWWTDDGQDPRTMVSSGSCIYNLRLIEPLDMLGLVSCIIIILCKCLIPQIF